MMARIRFIPQNTKQSGSVQKKFRIGKAQKSPFINGLTKTNCINRNDICRLLSRKLFLQSGCYNIPLCIYCMQAFFSNDYCGNFNTGRP